MNRLLVVFLLVFLPLFSWVGTVYELPVNNLLSYEGLRWWMNNLMNNLQEAPLMVIVLVLFVVSSIHESHLSAVHRDRKDSLKAKRALQYTILLAVLFPACLVLLMYLLPETPLLSAFGTFQHSPVQKAFFPMFCAYLVFLSLLYGRLAGVFSSLHEAIRIMTHSLAVFAPASVPIVFMSLCIATTRYVLQPLHLPNSWFTVVSVLLYTTAFLPYIKKNARRSDEH